jgi:hypothetical protein
MAHVNKAHSLNPSVWSPVNSAKSEDEIADPAPGMDPEDGVIWVYSPEHEGGMMASTGNGSGHPSAVLR